MAMVMVPNCGVFTYRVSVPRLTSFSALKASARNWKLAFPVRRNVRAKAFHELADPTSSERRVCCLGTASFILIKSSGSNSAVECDLAKVEVAGSIPVSRSSFFEALPPQGLFV